MRNAIRGLVLGAMCAVALAAAGCEGQGFTPEVTPHGAADAAAPADTVTKTSALLYPDDISGCYRWTWTQGSRFAASSAPCGFDLYLHMTQPSPAGTLSGTMQWFPGADGSRPIVNVQPTTSWNYFNAAWWVNDPVTGIWYWFGCAHNANKWVCNQYEEGPPGTLNPDGTNTLTLLYSHGGN